MIFIQLQWTIKELAKATHQIILNDGIHHEHVAGTGRYVATVYIYAQNITPGDQTRSHLDQNEGEGGKNGCELEENQKHTTNENKERMIQELQGGG